MKVPVAFVIFAFFVGVSTCLELTSEKNGRLYGGKDVDIKDAKYMVQLEKNGEFICGATIVAPTFVLTAAHCLRDNSKGDTNFTMRLGSGSLKKGGTVLPVKSLDVIKHPKYDARTNDYDIAVIKLKEALAYNESVKCIERDVEIDDPKLGAVVQVSGWGKSRIAGRFEKSLKQINLTISTSETCFKKYLGRTTSRNICASERGVALCRGDGGNPLSIIVGKEPKLIGVASKIPFFGCNRKGYPFVFTYIRSPEIKAFLEDEVTGLC